MDIYTDLTGIVGTYASVLVTGAMVAVTVVLAAYYVAARKTLRDF